MAKVAKALKVPPHDIEAEKSVLGAILIDPGSIALVVEILRPDHFYLEEHRLIFSSMISLFEKHDPVDVVTLTAELKQAGNLKKIGGASYLSDLINTVPTSAYVEHYAQIVKSQSIKRSLITIASRLVEQAFDEKGEVKKLLDEAEVAIFSLSQAYLHRDFLALKEILAQSFERLEALAKKGTGLRGISTGFSHLDAKLAGMQESNLIILAARPAVGKTTLGLNIALHAALKEKAPVAIFSLEMSKEELVDRLLVGQADIDAWRLKTGRLSDDDYSKLTEAMGELSEAPIYIDDTPGVSILEMRTKSRKLKMEKGIRFLIVDYLQLVNPGRRFDNRVQEVSFISQSLKNLARELKIPVLALSQLSRAVEHRGEKKPQLSDLRESGCLTGETKIILADGRKVAIQVLAKRKRQVPLKVLSLDKDYKIKPAVLVKAFSTGVKEVFLLKTALGKKIQATGNHRFYTPLGWKRLDELKEGDKIAGPRLLPIESPNSNYKRQELVILAHMIGDGCYVNHQPIHYTSASLESIKEVERAAFELLKIKGRIVRQKKWYHLYLPSPYRLARGRNHPFIKWLREKGLDFARSVEKRLPKDLLSEKKENIALFLKHLWATDGYIGFSKAKGKERVRIYYSTTSEILAYQIMTLLLRLGIVSFKKERGKRGYKTNYQIHIIGKGFQQEFIEKVGVLHNREVEEKVKNALSKIEENPGLDALPKEFWEVIEAKKIAKGISWRELCQRYGISYPGTSLLKRGIGRKRLLKIAKVLQDDELKALAESDIYWDRVKEIVSLGKQEVYDATVEETHNFVADEIIVHNSIEQDADVVMFLYYEPESEDLLDQKKRLIKLNIAKHRNGPTGEIELMFRADRVRFYGVKK